MFGRHIRAGTRGEAIVNEIAIFRNVIGRLMVTNKGIIWF